MKKLRSIILLAFMAVGLASSAQNQFVDITNTSSVSVYVYFQDNINPPTAAVLVPAGGTFPNYNWGYLPGPSPRAMITVAGCPGPTAAYWFTGFMPIPGCPTGATAYYTSVVPGTNDQLLIMP